MTPEELEKKRKAIRESYEVPLRQMCRFVMPKRILEWGPGRSTEIILEEVPYADVHCIEHDPKWFNHYEAQFKGNFNVKIMLRRLSMKGGQSEGYINYPLWKSNGRYDLAFIDGRSRCDCLVAAFLVADYVIIHDAHRPNYQKVFGLYKNKFIDKKTDTAILSNKPLDFFTERRPIWFSGMNIQQTMNEIIHLMAIGADFFFTRMGDAELYVIKDPLFANKRHQPKDDQLSKELKEAICCEHPHFMMAFTFDGWPGSKLRGLHRIASEFYRGTVYNVHVFHRTFLENWPLFLQFLRCFTGKRVCLIGGPTVCGSSLIKKVFNIREVVELSDTNAYDMLDPKIKDIYRVIKDNDIVVAAMGHAATALAKRLAEKGIRTQFIDIGSVIDAIAGVTTRTWISQNLYYILDKRKELEAL